MNAWAIAAGALACVVSSVVYAQSPILGKWCDNSHQNGTRVLIVENLDGSKVSGRYQWTGPGRLDEAIGGTFSDGRFQGGSTVRLNIKLNESGNLAGTATRDQELFVTFKRCQ